MPNKIVNKARGVIVAGLVAACTLTPTLAFAADNTASQVGSGSNGTGQTTLTLISVDDGSEHSETGANVAFTYPSEIKYVVKADGTLTGPAGTVAYIESKSQFPIHVSSMQSSAETDWHIVNSADATTSATTNNNVYLMIGPASKQENLADHLTKQEITASYKSAWQMTLNGDKVQLGSGGNVGKIDKDITNKNTFGHITWYIKAGIR